MSIQPEENTPQMIEKMVMEIKRAVDAKDFQGAKDLRDKLMESNPMYEHNWEPSAWCPPSTPPRLNCLLRAGWAEQHEER